MGGRECSKAILGRTACTEGILPAGKPYGTDPSHQFVASKFDLNLG
jgi:hypothetical protein